MEKQAVNDAFLSMDSAPRDGTVIVGHTVAGNAFDVKWMDDRQDPNGLIAAGWYDMLAFQPVELLGWRPIETASAEDGQSSGAPISTVGALLDRLATLPRELRIVLASDAEGNEFHFLADTGHDRAWNEEGSVAELVDIEEAKEQFTEEQIASQTIEVLVLWP